MALIPITPPGSSVDCTSCTATRNLVVNFTAATPTPVNGYIVKWKKVSETIWTTLSGSNPTSSPVTISNVPACEDLDVSIQSSCGGGQFSSEVFTVAAGIGFPLKCGCTYQGSTSNLTFYQYPSVALDLTGASTGDTITLSYNAIARANRFDIYNETDLTITATSGWVGDGGYSGPWDPGTPGSANGTLTFTYNSAKTYSLKVQVAGANPANQVSDSWSVNLTCQPATTGIITITNSSNTTVQLTNFNPAWFTIDQGTPSSLTAGNSASGTHSGYTGNWGITVGNVSSGCLVLYKNEGVLVDSIPITATGVYTFTNLSLLSTDDITLQYASSCPSGGGGSGGSGGGSGGGGGVNTYDCVNGNCVATVGGAYNSLVECQQSGCAGGGGQPQE